MRAKAEQLMASGIPKSEQAAIVGLVLLIAAGLAYQSYKPEADSKGVWVDGSSGWKPVIETVSKKDLPAAAAGQSRAAAATTTKAGATAHAASRDSTSTLAMNSGKGSASPAAIDINRANVSELSRLPGIGASKAQAIIDYRQASGPFHSVDELTKVRGIGEKTLERFKVYATVGPPVATGTESSVRVVVPAATQDALSGATQRTPLPLTAPQTKPLNSSPSPSSRARPSQPVAVVSPVNVNTAGERELETIPGIGPALAKRIIEYRMKRPFNRPEDLIAIRGIGPKNFQKMRGYVKVR